MARPDRTDGVAEHPTLLRFGCWLFWHFFLGVAGVPSIRSGAVECRHMFPFAAPVVHSREEIHVLRSRLLPWPFRTSLELIDEDSGRRIYLSPSWGFASFGGYHSVGRIVEALTEAEFTVRDRRIWLAA